jgi:hypothetical protein
MRRLSLTRLQAGRAFAGALQTSQSVWRFLERVTRKLRPYYGQFVGGVVLGSILAATGVGIVPYAPQPNLCWYWADPYMYRGYWDYCY